MAEKTIDQLEYIALPEDLSTVRVPININGQTVRTNIEDLVAKIKLQTFSRNIGEIVPSILPLTDSMLHLIDGGIISSIGIYSAFATYLNTFVVEYPNLFCDEATWQSTNTTYGQCAKFVIDDVADTIRLPKITEYIKGVSSLSELGTVLGAGLPNITGSFIPSTGDGARYPSANGAIQYQATTNSNGSYLNNDARPTYLYTLDASRSSAIYGNSDTVIPNTAKASLYLVLGNIVKTDIVVDIDEIITDLNLKADRFKQYMQQVKIIWLIYLLQTIQLVYPKVLMLNILQKVMVGFLVTLIHRSSYKWSDY